MRRALITQVLIDFDSNVMGLQQPDDFRIAVSIGIHYVEPSGTTRPLDQAK